GFGAARVGHGYSGLRDRASRSPARPRFYRARLATQRRRGWRGCDRGRTVSSRSVPAGELAQLQRWFASVMTAPQSASHAIESAATLGTLGGGMQVDALIRPNARQTSSERMEIYRRAYRARLIDCLLDDYPALANALGTESKACFGRYVAEYPSRSV